LPQEHVPAEHTPPALQVLPAQHASPIAPQAHTPPAQVPAEQVFPAQQG
jgi:hypothetical protein